MIRPNFISRSIFHWHRPRLVSVALCAGVCAGCYTTKNVVAVSPLETRYPVSATAQYVDGSGNIITEREYQVVKPFEFERTMTGPRHSETEARLALEPELDRFVQSSNGEAVTDLKIEAVEYDSGSHGSAAGWKIMGWTFGISGATFLVVGAADKDLSDVFIPMGAVFAGLGALSFIASAGANSPSEWKFHVKGSVVKRTELASPPPAVSLSTTGVPAPVPAAPMGPAATAVEPSTKAVPSNGAQCVPPCRSSYVCVAGRCVSACNPPCASNEFCTANGVCVSACNPRCPAGEICMADRRCAPVAVPNRQ